MKPDAIITDMTPGKPVHVPLDTNIVLRETSEGSSELWVIMDDRDVRQIAEASMDSEPATSSWDDGHLLNSSVADSPSEVARALGNALGDP